MPKCGTDDSMHMTARKTWRQNSLRIYPPQQMFKRGISCYSLSTAALGACKKRPEGLMYMWMIKLQDDHRPDAFY